MDKIALITGASKGIGKEFASIFAKHGYSLILIARNTQELTDLQAALKNQYQCESAILSVDLTKPESIDQIVTAFKDELKNVEVLVNNAGYSYVGKFTDSSPGEVLEGMISVNVMALTKLTYHLLGYMLPKKRGKILNVSSTAAFQPGPYMSEYYASKAYVLSFSRGIHEEYKKDGITISALCPGVTPTGFQKRSGEEGIKLFRWMPATSAQQVAQAGYNGLMQGKRVIIPGLFNKFLVFNAKIGSSTLSAIIAGWLQKPKKVS